MMKYRTILNAGSIAGLLSFLMFLVSIYLLSMNPMGPIKYISFAMVIVLIYRSLKMYNEIELEGFGSFRQILTAGMVFSFVYASLHGMLVYMHGFLFDAGFVDVIINDNLQQLGEAKDQMIAVFGKDYYRDIISDYQNATLESISIGDAFLKNISAIFVSLILALVLRKKPPIFDNIDE